jgi:tetratricopeptide (TPR) repeat protein
LDKACSKFEKAVSQDPKYGYTMYLLGKLEECQNNNTKVIDHYQKAASLKDSYALLALSCCYKDGLPKPSPSPFQLNWVGKVEAGC